MNNVEAVYRGVLKEHYRAPHNHGDLAGCEAVARVDNPLCGDELEVGVRVAGGRLDEVRFLARACAICMASGSLMTLTARDRAVDEIAALMETLGAWFDEAATSRPQALPETLAPLDVVRRLPTRRRCVLLPWEGLQAVIESLGRRAK